MSDKPATVAGAADRYSAAVDRMRETAKWLITVFAGLGAALIAGTQLSSVGKLNRPGGWPYLLAAGASLIVALAAVARIIWQTAKVLTAGEVTLHGLLESANPQSKELKERQWLRDHELLGGFDSVQQLRDQLETVRAVLVQQIKEGNPPPHDKAYEEKGAVGLALGGIAQNLTSGVRYYRVAEALRSAQRSTFRAGAVAAVAIIAVVFLAGAPESPPAAPPESFVVPVVARMTLNALGQQALGPTLGRECVASAERLIIVVGVAVDSYDAVTIPSTSCKVARFRMTGPLGSVVAADTARIPPTPTSGYARVEAASSATSASAIRSPVGCLGIPQTLPRTRK